MTPLSIRKKFFEVLSDAENNISSFVNHPDSDMTRHRYCDFTDTVLSTMNFSMCKTNTELINYFGFKRHIPSKSAFTQQRKKFNKLLFPYLLDSFNKAVPFNKTYKGFHIVAADGSDINLPTDKKDTVYRVKQARSDNFYYQMHINALFDVCENRYISAITQPRPQMNENEAFCQLIDDCSMPENTIFISDRGYITLNTIAHLINRNRYFVIRAKSPASSGSLTRHLMEPDTLSDRFISIGVTRSKKNRPSQECDVVKVLSSNSKFNFINPDDRTSFFYMSVRCTCIKLDDDSYEYLISNLPVDVFSSHELKELYWKRWSIETSFRSLKYALSLVYLHSVNRELIIQEIYAKMILYNLTSLIHSYVQKSRELLELNKTNTNKHKYKVAFDNAVPIVKELLKCSMSNRKIKALLLRNLTSERVTNPSARHVRSQSVNPLNNRA